MRDRQLLVAAGKFVFPSGRLLVAGRFVFKTGTLLMAGKFVVPPILPLSALMLVLVAGVSVEPLGAFWLQPTNANAARIVMTDGAVIDLMMFMLLREPRYAAWRSVAMG